MKQVWMRRAATAALGLALFAAGCGDNGENGTPPPAGLAPAAPPEGTLPDGNLPPAPGAEPGSSGTDKERGSDSKDRSQRR